MRFDDYFTAKLVTLTALAIVVSLAVTLIDYGLGFQPLPFLVGVVLTSVLMVLVGLITAVPYPSISEWLMPSLVPLTVLNLPLIDYSGLWPHPLFSLVPTQGPLLLLGAAFNQVSPESWQVIYAVGYPVLWIGILYLVARRIFYRYVVSRQGSV